MTVFLFYMLLFYIFGCRINFQVEMEGLTGSIKFDARGLRTNFRLNLVEMHATGLAVVGSWNSINGANFTRMHTNIDITSESLFNKTLIVSTLVVITENRERNLCFFYFLSPSPYNNYILKYTFFFFYSRIIHIL